MLTIDEISQIAVNALEDIKGENIVVLNTHELSPLFSRMLVCTGSSNRQVKSLANNVVEEFKKNQISLIGVEGEAGGEWVLVDCGDVVVHIMLPQVRAYNDLESLWNGQRPA